jgi:hypothetical protein
VPDRAEVLASSGHEVPLTADFFRNTTMTAQLQEPTWSTRDGVNENKMTAKIHSCMDACEHKKVLWQVLCVKRKQLQAADGHQSSDARTVNAQT